MSSLIKQILFYVVVLLSNIIQSITGFAGTVLAMPFGLILVGYNTAKPVLNVLGILASVLVVIFNHKKLNWKQFRNITLLMLPGMAVGMILMRYLDISKKILYLTLSIIILVFTAIGIYDTFIKPKEKEPDSFLHYFVYVILFLAGVVHGMFVCGGPLLIIYATMKLKDRDEFRSTLSMSWIVLNAIILIGDIRIGFFSGDATIPMLETVGISSLCLVVAVLIGDKIAKKLHRNVFMILTYVLMAVSAVSLILSALGVIG